MVLDNMFLHIETLLFKDDGTQTAFSLFDITLPTAIDAQAANVTRILNTTDQLHYIKADLLFSSSGNAPNGTVTIEAGNASDDDEVEINGLIYTAKTVVTDPATQFEIGGTPTITATNLETVINDDTRIGTLGNVKAFVDVVTIVSVGSSEPAPEGDTVTLSTTGANITVSGATFSSGQQVNHDWRVLGRTITVEEDFVSSEIPNFFTGIDNSPAVSRVIPIPLENNDGKVKYLILYIQSTTFENANGALFTGSIETPENTTPIFPIFEDLGPVVNSFIIQRKVQQDTANRIYDYFAVDI